MVLGITPNTKFVYSLKAINNYKTTENKKLMPAQLV